MITTIDTQKASELIAANKDNRAFHIIDIRTPEEFASGFIKGAVNIDFYSDEFDEKIGTLDKHGIYLVYCRSGNRSGKSMKVFTRLGFKTVYDMAGGIGKWVSEKRPLESR